MIIYAGSYTQKVSDDLDGHGDGIYTLDFDPGSGNLRHMATCRDVVNPSYLCMPSGDFLYTHSEVAESASPRAQAYRINRRDHSLERFSEQPVPGGYPCHVAYSEKHRAILEACYETGNVAVFPLAEDGSLRPAETVLSHEGRSIDPLRQERAHAHAVAVDDRGGRLLVTDLGIDRLMIYRVEEATGRFIRCQELAFPAGSGPRHLVWHPGGEYVFVVAELTSAVSVLRYHDGRLSMAGVYETLPADFTALPSGAAIRVSPDGRFVYASERSDGKVAVFRFDASRGTLELTGRMDTGGRTPRDVIPDPTGRWLLAANQDSDTIGILEIDHPTGALRLRHVWEGIRSPACLAWWPG